MKVKFYFGEAFKLILKTMPFIWARLASYMVLGLALALYFSAVGAVAWLLSKLWEPMGLILFIVALAGAVGIVKWASRYYFYMLKAAHTAVMTEFIVYGKGPQGSQIAYGKEQVISRFKDTSIMFGIDLLVDGVVKAFTRSISNMAGILPIRGMDSLTKAMRKIALLSTTYIDEAILSRAYKNREENVWKSAHEGVILYAQAWKPILANAAILFLINYVEFLLFIVVFGFPAAAIAMVAPSLSIPLAIGVLILAWMSKLALSDAYSLAVTLIAYHRATDGLEPNQEWAAKLESISDKFKELTEKASKHGKLNNTSKVIPKTENVAAQGNINLN